MGARYPFYLLAPTAPPAEVKEAQLTHTAPYHLSRLPMDDIRQGFVYERVPHRSHLNPIANNSRD